MNIKGKNVIVTGGAKGIGRSVAEKLTQAGAKVSVLDIDSKKLKELKKQNSSIYCQICDVTNYQQVTAVVNKYFKKFRQIDILINNAGYIYNSPLVTITATGIKKHDVDSWHKVVDIDLNSVFNMTVNVAEKMIINRTKGVIINVSSISAGGNAGQSAYSAAKAGINALTAAWAKELGLWGIRVAAIAPGFTATETMQQAMSEAVINEWRKKTPLRRLGKPEEIADGILSIIKNDYFTGKVLELDGGLCLGS